MKYATRALVLMGGGLFFASCDSKQTADSGVAEPGIKAVTSAPISLPDKSRFIKELEQSNYPVADAPAEPPLLRWDFSKPEIEHEYVYEQKVRANTHVEGMHSEMPESEQAMLAKGSVVIRSQGDATADLVFKDMKLTLDESESGGMEQKVPPMVFQGMKEDGSGTFATDSQYFFLKALFTLPAEKLKVGDSFDVPMSMPYNAMGSVLLVKGQSKITLTRYVLVDGRLCARFDVETDVSKMNAPPELQGEHQISTKAVSVFFFDVKDRCFVSGSIALLMVGSSEAPAPQLGDAENKDESKPIKMTMVSDNLIRIDLKK